MSLQDNALFGHLADTYGLNDRHRDELTAMADAIRGSLFQQQRDLITDPHRRKAALVPRRGGKSFAAASYAFDVCLRRPNARTVIISLSYKTGKKNYWVGGDAVIPRLVGQFGIPAKPYQNELRLQFTNGSNLWLVGADKRDAIEDLRGDQYDLVIIDECKSYPRFLLDELIDEVVQPALRDRRGTLLLIGTPGSKFEGPFFEATYPGHKKGRGTTPEQRERLTSRSYHEPEQYWLLNSHAKVRPLWSRHTWSIRDNVAMPHLWDEACEEKEANGWADDEPIWLRESLAQWVQGSDEFVYAYANLASTDPDKVHWTPDHGPGGNDHGLTPADSDWRYLLGVDTGYVDAFALVVGAYNPHDGVLYHVWDYHCPRLDPISQAERIQAAVERFGKFSAIVVDPGGGGKGLAEMMRSRFGLPVRIAEKTQRRAYQEFLNADFRAGKVKVLPRSDLATQLATLQFDMSSGMKLDELARREKLVENGSQANDLCDAFLYMWRYSYHYYRKDRVTGPAAGTPEAHAAARKAAMDAFAKQQSLNAARPDWTNWSRNINPLEEYTRGRN